ncbi:MAG TPA: hypothetical protein VD948_04095, partial [Rhodothermales bacterium]|nr:hypothetical protein [Rhodothermales bacterium]
TLRQQIEAELEAAGLSLEELKEIAARVGISLEELTPDTLQAFLDQIGKATEGLAEMGEELRNAPEGFKVALARFNASTPEAVVAGAGTASYVAPQVNQTFMPGAFTIQGKTGEELWRDFQRVYEREAARGGATVFAVMPA